MHEDSLEGICNSFIANRDAFESNYGPFLLNSEQGQHILAEYGGSFFTDKQREVEDEEGIITHYTKPRARLVEYMEVLRDLSNCAQKQYLHGVSLVKVCYVVSDCIVCVMWCQIVLHVSSHVKGLCWLIFMLVIMLSSWY